MNVAFVKIKLSLLALFEICGILKSYFSFFVKRSASDHRLKQLLSFFFMAS